MTSQTILLALGVLLITGSTIYMNYESKPTIDHGFTADFATFIKAFDSKYDFIRSDITWSTYGYTFNFNIIVDMKNDQIQLHQNIQLYLFMEILILVLVMVVLLDGRQVSQNLLSTLKVMDTPKLICM